jgi:hypothetical protein
MEILTNSPRVKTTSKAVPQQAALVALRCRWDAVVHIPSQGRTQGQSWNKQEEERAHLKKRRTKQQK